MEVAADEAGGVYAFGFDHARVERIDPNLLRSKLLRESLGDRVDSALGGAIDGCCANTIRSDGTDVDNAAAVGVEGFEGRLGSQNQPQHVGVELLVEVLRCHGVDGSELIDPSVVHENADGPEFLDHGFDQRANRVGIRHAALDYDRLAAGGLDVRYHLFGLRLAARVVHCDGCAIGRQFLCDGRANALGCASYECDFTIELAHIPYLLYRNRFDISITV